MVIPQNIPSGKCGNGEMHDEMSAIKNLARKRFLRLPRRTCDEDRTILEVDVVKMG